MRCSGLLVGLTLVGLVFPVGSRAQETADDRPGVAVFPFENGGSFGEGSMDLQPLTVGLQQMLLTELQRNTDLRIVERTHLRGILDEIGLGETDRVDAATAARAGRIVGARYAIAGTFMDWNGEFRLDCRVFSVETTEILGTESVQADADELYGLVVQMAGRVMKDVQLEPLDTDVVDQLMERELPVEAAIALSRAEIFWDRGDSRRAIELYQQVVNDFPDYTEARERLETFRSAS